jgi:hypothetical protein
MKEMEGNSTGTIVKEIFFKSFMIKLFPKVVIIPVNRPLA